MAFKLETLNASVTYKYPVKFAIIAENGETIEQEFTAIFKRLDRAQIVDLRKRHQGDSGDSIDQVLDADIAYITEFLTGWEGVDLNGATEFNKDNLRLLLKSLPKINIFISSAFFDSDGAVARKN